MTIVERVYWDVPEVYCYDPYTGEFTVFLKCDSFGNVPNKYLKPDFCTTDIPKECGLYQKNKINKFNNWVIVPDYRRIPLYNKLTKEVFFITEFAVDCPPTHTPIKPPSEDFFIVWHQDLNQWVEDITLKLEYNKGIKKASLLQEFHLSFTYGYLSPSLNAVVDCRRSGIDNDLQNYQALYDYMVANSVQTTMIRLCDNSMKGPITQEELRILILELIAYALSSYQRKWGMEAEIDACTTQAELDAIRW